MLRLILLVILTISSIASETLNLNDKTQIEFAGPIGNCENYEKVNKHICLAGIIEDLKPLVFKNLEDMGITNWDPIKIGTVEYDKSHGPFSLQLLNKNIKIFDVPNYSLMKLKIDTNENTISFSYYNPQMKATSNYKAKGKVFFYPIKGSGPIFLEAYGLKFEGKTKFHKGKNEQGENVIQISETVLEHMSLKNANLRIHGLFDGNPLLSAVVHYFMNNYSSEVFDILKPEVAKFTQDFMTNSFLNPLLSKIPELSDYILDN